MSEPKFQRRKDDRPQEIAEAAFSAFAEKGYAATRVADVARRAGVSKGLMYLYFKTKQDLFRAVIRQFVVPQVREVARSVDLWPGTAAEFLRGPFRARVLKLLRSRLVVIFRLMIAEGPKHPDLTAYYHENVISVVLQALQKLVRRAVDAGEFAPTPITRFPQLLITPMVFAAAWSIVFEPHEKLPAEDLIDAHLETLLRALEPA
ncbi:MAG: TetR/AcrR family transcriptional regulator [Pseudomonadota bacterium]